MGSWRKVNQIIYDKYGEILEEDKGVYKSYEQIKKDRVYFESKKQLEALKEEKSKFNEKFIWFYFDFDKQAKLFPNLKPQDIFRLFYLATYCGYNDNILRVKGKNIDNIKLKSIMKLTDPQYYKWHKLMIDLGYLVKVNTYYKLNEVFFNRGSLIETSTGATRIFINTIQELYASLKAVEHYKVGYALRLIPFLNPYTNFLVADVSQKDKTKLVPLDINSIVEYLGFSKKSSKRIINEMLSVKLVKNEQTMLKLFDLSNDKYNDRFLSLAPNLLFGGTLEEYKEINILFK